MIPRWEGQLKAAWTSAWFMHIIQEALEIVTILDGKTMRFDSSGKNRV